MSRLPALFIFLAALNGFLAVLAGAWAAHGFGLPLIAGGDVLAESGSQVQMWHALALLAVGLGLDRLLPGRPLWLFAGFAFLAGIAAFSGGLYAMAGGLSVGSLAPVGGAALMAGWLALALAGLIALVSR